MAKIKFMILRNKRKNKLHKRMRSLTMKLKRRSPRLGSITGIYRSGSRCCLLWITSARRACHLRTFIIRPSLKLRTVHSAKVFLLFTSLFLVKRNMTTSGRLFNGYRMDVLSTTAVSASTLASSASLISLK